MMQHPMRHALHRLDQARRKRLGPAFTALGLPLGQGQPRILSELLAGQPLTQKQLADRCEQDAAAMSRTLDKMQQAGLVQRLPHPESRRCLLIALTPEGESTARQVQKLFDDLEQDLCRGFSPAQQAQLLDALAQMLRNLQPE